MVHVSKMGPSPSRRPGHAMVSHGTPVFVLGGEALAEGQADDTALIHVRSTSMSFIFIL